VLVEIQVFDLFTQMPPRVAAETALLVEGPYAIVINMCAAPTCTAGIAQLGERQTEDLKVSCSIHDFRTFPLEPGPR